jgi:hypothetical protein
MVLHIFEEIIFNYVQMLRIQNKYLFITFGVNLIFLLSKLWAQKLLLKYKM